MELLSRDEGYDRSRNNRTEKDDERKYEDGSEKVSSVPESITVVNLLVTYLDEYDNDHPRPRKTERERGTWSGRSATESFESNHSDGAKTFLETLEDELEEKMGLLLGESRSSHLREKRPPEGSGRYKCSKLYDNGRYETVKRTASEETRLIVYMSSGVNDNHYWEGTSVVHGDTVKAVLCGNLPIAFAEEWRRSKVCFKTFKKMSNEFGKPCWSESGSAVVNSAALLSEKDHRRGGDGRDSQKDVLEVDLKMHTSEDMVTGRLLISFVDEKDEDATLPVESKRPSLYTGKAKPDFSTSYEETLERLGFTRDSIFVGDPLNPFLVPSDSEGLRDQREVTTHVGVKFLDARETRALFEIQGAKRTPSSIEEVSKPSLVEKSAYSSERCDGKPRGNSLPLSYESAVLEPYFRTYSEEDGHFPDWIRGSESVRCPYYPSQVTVGDSKLFLPFSSFVLTEPTCVSPKYWINAVILSYERLGYRSFEDFLKSDLLSSNENEYAGANADDDDETIRRKREKNATRKMVGRAVNMICQLTHSMEYITDKVEDPTTGKEKNIELFGDPLSHPSEPSDDCDGLSLSIFQMFDDFLFGQKFDDETFSKHEKTFFDREEKEEAEFEGKKDEYEAKRKERLYTFSRIWKLLRTYRRALKSYIPFLCIEGVSSPSAQNQQELKDKGPRITGAHAAIKFLPIKYFKKCLKEWDRKHPLLSSSFRFHRKTRKTCGGPFEHLPFQKPFKKRKKCGELDGENGRVERAWKKKYYSFFYDGWKKKLPILIGEGTGMLSSYGESDPSFPGPRSYLYSCKELRSAKKPLYPPKGESCFYKAVLFGTTNRFLRPYKVGTFRFCTVFDRSENRNGREEETEEEAPSGLVIRRKAKREGKKVTVLSSFSRGVLFTSLMKKSAKVALVPCGDSSFKMATDSETSVTSGKTRRLERGEFDDMQLAVISETLKTRIKPRPLTAGEFSVFEKRGSSLTVARYEGSNDNDKFVESKSFLALKRLYDRVNRKNRLERGNRHFTERTVTSLVTVFYSDYYATEENCNAIYEHLSKPGPGLRTGFSFSRERLSLGSSLWKLDFLFTFEPK